jgi:hypothetical protein
VAVPSENGTVIIRVPNKFALIFFWQFLIRVISQHKDNEMRDHIKFFNPEHLFVFSKRYLLTRLKSIGFQKVIAFPSELLIQDNTDLRHPFFYYLCKVCSTISFGKIIISPSLLLIAKKGVSSERNSA